MERLKLAIDWSTSSQAWKTTTHQLNDFPMMVNCRANSQAKSGKREKTAWLYNCASIDWLTDLRRETSCLCISSLLAADSSPNFALACELRTCKVSVNLHERNPNIEKEKSKMNPLQLISPGFQLISPDSQEPAWPLSKPFPPPPALKLPPSLDSPEIFKVRSRPFSFVKIFNFERFQILNQPLC